MLVVDVVVEVLVEAGQPCDETSAWEDWCATDYMVQERFGRWWRQRQNFA